MKSVGWMGWVAVASLAMAAGEKTAANNGERNAASPGLPNSAPVLRSFEPAESVVFRLPGPAPVRPVDPAARKIAVAPPVPVPSTIPVKLSLTTPPDVPGLSKATLDPAKPGLSDEAAREMAFYCQKNIGKWKVADARMLLGAPLRNRPAYDENKVANGKIYAFRDPTGRYRELELDFDSKTGTLRTVFGYPPRLTWPEVRRRWSGEVTAADAQQGRKFYSYANRRMDVLVDPAGKVISLGLY
jgi:hypothetical protein